MSTHSLNESRRNAADNVFVGHGCSGLEEGTAIADCGEWEAEGDVWKIDVYLERDGTESQQTFKVKFSPDSTDVDEAGY